MKKQTKLIRTKIKEFTEQYKKQLFMLTATMTTVMMTTQTVSAATEEKTMWEKASEIMQNIYTQILGISTIAAVVTAAIALFMMNFSKNGRTVDESRAWLKRIIITWIILNSLGFIVSYLAPYLSGGEYKTKL